jgi:DNA (cytosine-5)-methyltransferase 1
MILKIGELFCGPGGIALGAKYASTKDLRFKHTWSTDYDKDTCETYRMNFFSDGEGSAICKDIKAVDFKKLPAVDGLTFGFPCNDFSLVGEQKGFEGDYGPLYTYCAKGLKVLRPKFFFAENVGGLRNSNEGKALTKILDTFSNLGYQLTAHYYKFEEYGVPQSRHRVIIVGIRNDLDLVFKVPKPTHKIFVGVKEALENPPIAFDAPNNELTKQSEVVIRRLKHIKPGENAFNANLPHELKLNVKGAKISQIYKRLDPSKPSYTITGSGGGGTHVYHWLHPRALTNRERARLQTFPDNFVFSGTKESVRRQIGMAVPPIGAKVVFEAIRKTFLGIEYASVKPNITPEIALLLA